jgi:ATP-dependent helicase HrpA
VLATNVAETSLTVPGIKYVIDPGTARMFQVQPPYQGAAAAHRADLAGLGQPAQGPLRSVAQTGICIRLYSEEDFESRPEFTDPEILRTNLASVILQMAAIGLGDVPRFPFVDPPDARNIADGLTLLDRAERVLRRPDHRPGAQAGPACRWTRASAG